MSNKGIKYIKPDNNYDIWDEKRRAKMVNQIIKRNSSNNIIVN